MAFDGITIAAMVSELNKNLHSFAVTYAHLSLESLLFPCFQAFFILKFRHILLAFCIVLWYNKYYTKRSACYVPQKNTKPEWSDSPFHC